MIAALYVDPKGPYFGRPDVDLWDEKRDARTYSGPHSVVAHPPCERWGRYWSGGPSAKARRELGDDGGCFAAALSSVRAFGGVLEHPEASHAFRVYELGRPAKSGGWVRSPDGQGWICCVEQGHYGHRARKATWLYYMGPKPPPDLIWGPSTGERIDEGFHSSAERRAARVEGRAPVKRLSKAERIHTPEKFAEVLLSLARGSR